MSRIGRAPIALISGVSAKIDKNIITVTGPKGTLTQDFDAKNIEIKIEETQILVLRKNEQNDVKAKHGLYRALIANMVTGVSTGFSKKLIINGVGFKAVKDGNDLNLNLGFSHPCKVVAEDGIEFTIPANNEILVSGISKEKVGHFAAKIRDLKKVEPYHAYGVRYSDEVVVRKQGKTSGKGKK